MTASIVYAYQGGRDQALEQEILSSLPGARCRAATPNMQGLVEVTLDLPDSLAVAAVERLRGMPRIVDAARGSFGEGA